MRNTDTPRTLNQLPTFPGKAHAKLLRRAAMYRDCAGIQLSWRQSRAESEGISSGATDDAPDQLRSLNQIS